MYCFGGHGRTGTVLSVLACLTGIIEEGTCPVAWLRNHYCDRAVESDEQADYIEAMTGFTVTTSIYSWKSYSTTSSQYKAAFSVYDDDKVGDTFTYKPTGKTYVLNDQRQWALVPEVKAVVKEKTEPVESKEQEVHWKEDLRTIYDLDEDEDIPWSAVREYWEDRMEEEGYYELP